MEPLPMLWAQSPAPPGALALLALRRWCGSLTLSPPDSVPRPYGLWAWLGGLLALLVVALIAQGPGRALGQLLDVPGHARLLASALGRLRRSGRLVAIVCGVAVLTWTANLIATREAPQGLADLEVIRKSRGPAELAVEQGLLAALTPLRDLGGLGDLLVLSVVAGALTLQLTSRQWGDAPLLGTPLPGWSTAWGLGVCLYAIYRVLAMFDPGELPLGGLIVAEAVAIPLLALAADGLLLAWVLVELRSVDYGGSDEPVDTAGALALAPAAALACLAILPARHAATGGLLAFLHAPGFSGGVPLAWYLWLGWALVALQGLALPAAGLVGAVAWSRGTPVSAVRGAFRLVRAEGGRLVAALAAAGLAAGALAASAYAIVLVLPPRAWVLATADSYAHYATLPVGLVLASALVELGARSLPVAGRDKAGAGAGDASPDQYDSEPAYESPMA